MSVVVTCYNYARYIVQAVESVARQTYKNFDCVVVDDKSTDGSADVIERWINDKKDSRFRLIKNVLNRGQTASFAAGLQATSGEFVAFLDADDFWFPEFIQRHVEAHLNRSFSVSASCSDMVQINEDGRALSGTWVGPRFRPKISDGLPTIDFEHSVHIDIDRDALQIFESPEVRYVKPSYLDHPWTPTSGMMFRRSALDLVMTEKVDELRTCTDGYIFLICHYFTGSLTIGSALSAYRRHNSNNFGTNAVLGNDLPSSPSMIIRQRKLIIRAMLEHLIAHYEDFANVFSDARVKGFVRVLFRKALQNNIPVKNSELRALIGMRGVVTDRMRAKLSFLRRLSQWGVFRRIIAPR